MSEREIDQALVERAQGGDQRAFDQLVGKYQRKLGRLLSRYIRDAAEIEDVSQEAFIKAYRALPSFRGDSAFYTWLYRIGINTAKNYLVSQGRRAPTTTEFDAEEAEGFDEHDVQVQHLDLHVHAFGKAEHAVSDAPAAVHGTQDGFDLRGEFVFV